MPPLFIFPFYLIAPFILFFFFPLLLFPFSGAPSFGSEFELVTGPPNPLEDIGLTFSLFFLPNHLHLPPSFFFSFQFQPPFYLLPQFFSTQCHILPPPTSPCTVLIFQMSLFIRLLCDLLRFVSSFLSSPHSFSFCSSGDM